MRGEEMRPALDKSVLVGAGLVVAALIVNAVLANRNTHQLLEDARWVAHTQEVLGRISGALLTLVDAETGYRGFVITGKEEFLEPFNAAIATQPGVTFELRSLTIDNPRQQERIEKLQKLSASFLSDVELAIALRREKGFEAAQALVAAGEGKRRMDALRRLAVEMTAEEEGLLVDRQRQTSVVYNVAVATSFIVAGLGLLAITAFVWLLDRSLSARRKAAAEVLEQQEWFRTTLTSIGDAVVASDPQGRVRYINDVAQQLTGWTQHDAAGQPMAAVFNIINEETRRQVENPVEKVLQVGRVVGLANHTLLIGRDGAERPIEDSAAPIRNEKGEIVGVVLVFHDVSERRQAENRLRLNELRYRSLVDATAAIVWNTPDLGEFAVEQPGWSAFTGQRFDELRGKGWLDAVHPQDRAETWSVCRRAIDSPMIYDVEHRLRRADGEYRWMSVRAVPIVGSDGAVDEWVGVHVDVTEQKSAEARLKESELRLRQLAADLSEADRRKDEFLATLAHELRNPLAPIRNGLEILSLEGHGGKAAEQVRTMMARQLLQMVRLVDDLMDVSRIARGKLGLKKARVQLAAVVNSAVETSRPLIEEMKHELTITLPTHPVALDADLTRLAQVILNLLNNAAKYSDRGGRIWLAAEQQGDEVAVSVRDAGIGIAAEQLPHIFDMFSQVDRSSERSQGGLGIGLTLVKQLVQMHGGRIDAASEGPGKGSEFIVRLPVAGEGSEQQNHGGADERRVVRSSLRVLIVDDNRDAADSLSIILNATGNDTRTVYDGEAAVTASSEFSPQVILLDIGLPKLNGYEACRRIRDQPGGKDIIIIAQTGWGQGADRQRTHEAGFDHHLVKPVDPAALMDLLADLPIDGA